jgi:hypothetical protein
MSSIHKISSNDHNQQQESTMGDLDDSESNISSNSTSSIIAHETIINDQPKYFDRKRRLLAAEQQISIPETEILITKKFNSYKKACLDEIVDSLNQKAQAEQEENNDEEDEDERVLSTKKNFTSPSTTIERDDEDEDIDIVENDR